MRRWNWNTPVMNLVHAFVVCINIAAGVFDIKTHHSWLSLYHFGIAVVFIVLNIGFGISLRRLDRRRQALMDRQERVMAAAYPPIGVPMNDADVSALANLTKIVQLFNAEINGKNCVDLIIGELRFSIYEDHIYRYRKSAVQFEQCGHTCYANSAAMPAAEKIATAMLLLHHDPSIFNRWANDQGNWYV